MSVGDLTIIKMHLDGVVSRVTSFESGKPLLSKGAIQRLGEVLQEVEDAIERKPAQKSRPKATLSDPTEFLRGLLANRRAGEFITNSDLTDLIAAAAYVVPPRNVYFKIMKAMGYARTQKQVRGMLNRAHLWIVPLTDLSIASRMVPEFSDVGFEKIISVPHPLAGRLDAWESEQSQVTMWAAGSGRWLPALESGLYFARGADERRLGVLADFGHGETGYVHATAEFPVRARSVRYVKIDNCGVVSAVLLPNGSSRTSARQILADGSELIVPLPSQKASELAN